MGSPQPAEVSPPTPGGWLRRVGLGSLWLLAARVLGQGLGLLFTALLARALGETGLGQFAFLSAVLFIGNAFTTFGLDTVLIRDVAAGRTTANRQPPTRRFLSPDDRPQTTDHSPRATRHAPPPAPLPPSPPALPAAALIIQLALSAVFIAALWWAGSRLPNQTAATLPALRLISLALIPLAFSTVYSALLRAHERLALYLVFTLVTAAGQALGGLAVVVGGGGLMAAAAVVVLAQSGGAIVAGWLARRALPDARRWAWPSAATIRRAARLGAGLAALMVLAMLYQRLGVLLLSLLASDAAAGAYSAALRVVEALKLLPGAFFGAMLPILSRDRGDAATQRVYRLTFAALLVAVCLMAAAVALLARPIMALLFGPGFESAAGALRLMIWSLPATVIAFRLSFDLVVGGRDRAAATAMGMTLLLGGGAMAALIMANSLRGAALGLIIGEVVQVALLLVLTRLGRLRPERAP